MKKLSSLLFAAMVFMVGVPTFAQEAASAALDPAIVEQINLAVEASASKDSMTMVWMILAGALVFLMQAGFAMVEVGLTRAKNAANILMKNLMDFAVGSLAFFLVGWGFMYGTSVGGWFGSDQFLLLGVEPEAWANKMRDWFFQVVFAATAATIVSGAMAERTKFSAYLVYSVFISALVYPIVGHWIWGGGWLFQMGFHDFAGSTVVHTVGGLAALAGAVVLGPRIGKYVTFGGVVSAKAIPGHNLPLAALGVFILWFGWYGFNAGSTLNGNDSMIGHIAVTTTLGAAAGAVAAMFLSWFLFKKPDISMTMNGALAGLVAITAPTFVVDPIQAILIGLVGGILVVFSVELLDKVFHIDDPVGAVSVHAVNGIWGTLAVGLFAVPGRLSVNNVPVEGLFYTGNWNTLLVQATGVGVVTVFVLAVMFALFGIMKAVKFLRVSTKEEVQGLDMNEHGADAYHGFQIFSNQ